MGEYRSEGDTRAVSLLPLCFSLLRKPHKEEARSVSTQREAAPTSQERNKSQSRFDFTLREGEKDSSVAG